MQTTPNTKPKIDIKKASSIYEILIGFTIITKGFEELPHFHNHPFSVGFIFFAGVFIILATAFHHQFEKRVRHSGGIFHILEGLVEIITAIILFQGIKRMIPMILFFIGLVYLSLGIIEHFQTPQNREHLMRRFSFWMGFAFILFASSLSIFNALTTNKLPAYIVCVLMVWGGVLLVFMRDKHFKKDAPFLKAFKVD